MVIDQISGTCFARPTQQYDSRVELRALCTALRWWVTLSWKSYHCEYIWVVFRFSSQGWGVGGGLACGNGIDGSMKASRRKECIGPVVTHTSKSKPYRYQGVGLRPGAGEHATLRCSTPSAQPEAHASCQAVAFAISALPASKLSVMRQQPCRVASPPPPSPMG